VAVKIERGSLLKELHRARADASRLRTLLEGAAAPRHTAPGGAPEELLAARDRIEAFARDTATLQVRPLALSKSIWAHQPPWRQPRGKLMVSLVNSHTNATSKR